MQMHKSAEDYLEKILMISNQNGIVRAIDIARFLDFSKASVSVAMKKLKESNYIVVDKNGDITLTKTGLEVANKIYERHEVLASIFISLGVERDVAYEDACKVEHDLSDETFDALKKYFEENKTMNLSELALKRHSVRHYIDKKIDENTYLEISNKVHEVNKESGLDIQVVLNEKEALDGFGPRFTGAENYLSMVGSEKDPLLEEKVGYYGEELVLFLTSLNLGTLWVAGSLNIDKVKWVKKGDNKLVLVIAFGYCNDFGSSRPSKTLEELANVTKDSPEWFVNGIKEVALAPSAMNRQDVYFKYIDENNVEAENGPSRWSKVDKGIAIYHFEIGSGKKIIKL